MAEKRMFTQKIIDSDAFLDMPLSAQALYFHLNMRADDDGFVNNPKKIQRVINASEDDLKLLLLKRFVIGFDSGVIVIKHWRMHNTLRKDRYTPTLYQDELAQLAVKDNRAYTEVISLPEPDGQPTRQPDVQPTRQPDVQPTWQPDDNQVVNQPGNQAATQIREDKNRLGLEKNREEIEKGEYEVGKPDDRRQGTTAQIPYEKIKDLYNEICVSYPKCISMGEARKKAIRARIKSGYTLEDFRALFEKAEASSFLKGKNNRNWSASLDWLLKDSSMAKVIEGNYDDKGGNDHETSGGTDPDARRYGVWL